MPLTLIDTHCHLNDREAFADPRAAIDEALDKGVTACIVIGVDLESSARAVELAEEHSEVYATVGCHPNYASNYGCADLQLYKAWLSHPKVVALGEVGLDFHWDYATPKAQEMCLLEQLPLALKAQKPVVFHCREANSELLLLLEQQPANRFVLHCFSGNQEDALRAQRLDCWFGIDGPITYPKSVELRELVKGLPRDRILIETDSPWLSPHPFRGKPNRPANLALINGALATALGMSDEDCAAMTTANAINVFGLPLQRS